jgi:hypothetical protein
MCDLSLKLIFFVTLFVILFNCMQIIKINNTVEMGLILLMVIITIILKRRKSNLLEFFSAPIDHKLGEYGGIKLDSGEHNARRKLLVSDEKMFKDFNNQKSNCKWMKHPCNVPLLKDVDIYNPTGESKKITPDVLSEGLPSVDGTEDERKKLFMFTYNQCRPECCPSTYTCDRGCVCTTEQQRKFLNTRGSNRNSDIFPNI